MCFHKTVRDEFPAINGVEITGFKVLKRVGTEWVSPIRGGIGWKLGKTKKLKNWENTPSHYSVNRGLHCYRSLTEAERNFVTNRKDCVYKVFLVTIPIGAKVYINNSQYCTDTMRLENLRPIQRVPVPVPAKKVIKKSPKKKK